MIKRGVVWLATTSWLPWACITVLVAGLALFNVAQGVAVALILISIVVLCLNYLASRAVLMLNIVSMTSETLQDGKWDRIVKPGASDE